MCPPGSFLYSSVPKKYVQGANTATNDIINISPTMLSGNNIGVRIIKNNFQVSKVNIVFIVVILSVRYSLQLTFSRFISVWGFETVSTEILLTKL